MLQELWPYKARVLYMNNYQDRPRLRVRKVCKTRFRVDRSLRSQNAGMALGLPYPRLEELLKRTAKVFIPESLIPKPQGLGSHLHYSDCVWVVREKYSGETAKIGHVDVSQTSRAGVQSTTTKQTVVSLRKHRTQSGVTPTTSERTRGNEGPLPNFASHLTQGRNRVRIANPNDFTVTAGIRKGKEGRDLGIPANRSGSFSVPDGRYDIYFVYSSDPAALYRGESFTLVGGGVEIQLVRSPDGNYAITKVE